MNQLDTALAPKEKLVADLKVVVTDAEELLAAKALEEKLDRSPKTLLAIEQARREILARAYMEQVLAAARGSSLPFLPGVMTPSDVIAAIAAGFDTLKLFPAKQAGGVGMLKALGGPFPQLRFCPTGGIDLASAPEFLALPNVACVGGSWLTPVDKVKAGDWVAITHLAATAAALRPIHTT